MKSIRKKGKLLCAMLLVFSMLLSLFSTSAMAVSSGAVEITAPDGTNLTMTVWVEDGIPYYQIKLNDVSLIEPSRLGLVTGFGSVTENVTLGEVIYSSKNETWDMVIGDKNTVDDSYNEAIIPLQSGETIISLVVRVYPSGVAFQYLIPEQEEAYTIPSDGELTQFVFPQDSYASVHIGGNQTIPNRIPVGQFDSATYRIPMTVEYSNGNVLTVCEANLNGYATTYLTKDDNCECAVRTKSSSNITVESKTLRATPWRALVIGEDLPQLSAHNDLVLNLNEPADEDTYQFSQWVEAGACLMTGGGMTTEGVKKLVDEAAEVGIKYVLMDYCWYGPELDDNCDPRLDPAKLDPNNEYDRLLSKYITEEGVFNTGEDAFPPYGLLDGTPVPGWPQGGKVQVNVNIPEICQYANRKNVGIMLYVNGRMLPDSAKNPDGSRRNRFTTDELFGYFEKWGVKGIKPGFVNCRDQTSEAYMEEVVKLAAKHHLIMTVHDEWVTNGLERTYPNLLTSEAILGDEGIGSTTPQAAEDIATVFTRTIQGPADHTFCYPGKATKAYALASPIVFRSGLQCLYWYTSPSDIAEGDRGKLDIWKDFPANWDETLCLEGKMYEYATYARRNGTTWYVGSLSATDRLLRIPLTFLKDDVTYVAEICADGVDADPNLGRQNGASCAKSAQTLEHERCLVNSTTVLNRYLRYGYGYAVKLTEATQEDIETLNPYHPASHLIQILEIANQYQNENYTAESWKALQDAIAAAEQLVSDGGSEEELSNAADAIRKAIDRLICVTDLEDLMFQASCLTSYLYTKDSWAPMFEDWQAAQKLLDQEDLTQSEIDAAAERLSNSLQGLTKAEGIAVASKVYLSDLEYEAHSHSDWSLRKDLDMEGGPLELIVNGEKQVFPKGMFSHANAEIFYNLEGTDYQVFESYIGVDNSKPQQGDIIFRVYGDGHLLYESPSSGNGSQEARFISVPISGIKSLRLVADANGTDNGDWADWADASFLTYVDQMPHVYQITVQTQGEGSASVDPATAGAGDTVTLTENAAEGWHFVEWVSDDVTVAEDNTFTMPGHSVTVTAVFEQDAHVHTLTKTEAKEPTCTEDGYTAYWYCEGCQKYFSDEEATAEITIEEAVIKALGHEFAAEWSKDESGHWHQCIRCDAIDQVEAHTPDRDAPTETEAQVCTVCGYVMASATGHITHTPSEYWSYDGNQHWHKCTGCEEKLDVADHSGGTATCTAQAICEVCGQPYGELSAHTYTEWKFDENQHWKVCADCGAEEPESRTDHDWTLERETETEQHYTCVCGAAKTVEIPLNITFAYNNGSDAVTVQVEKGQTVARPADPTNGDFDFDGWYTDAACTLPYDFNTPVTTGFTLYAGWKMVGPSIDHDKDEPSKPVEPEKPAEPEAPEQPDIEEPETPLNPAPVFTDVTSDFWGKEAIDYAVEESLMNGTSETTFAPNVTTTRAMLMTILARMDGVDTTGGSTWYQKGMEWAVAQGVSDGTNPEGLITREQLAVMLYRYSGSPAVSAGGRIFSDADQVSDWAMDGVKWAVANGIISGKGNNALDPQGNATRSEVAQMLFNFSKIGA